MNRKQKKTLTRILITAVMLIILHIVEFPAPWDFLAYLVPFFVVGHDILWKALRNIGHGQLFDENFLMVVATIGAMALGEYSEGVAVMFFYQIGEFFQSYAVGKSRRNITQLMDIRPDYANIEENGELIQVDPDDVEVGSIIWVRTGEKIPIDGVVVEGSSTLNTAALTGESLPREVEVGDSVISGCINMTGLLRIETTKAFEESTASRILDLVENAGFSKARSEKFITRFAKVYTPIVCGLALIVGLIPPLVRLLILQTSPLWGTWILRALTFLVISCPCALVISIPLSFFAGIGGAGNCGILIKGANYVEALAKADRVVFDKTGTMTMGVFEVVAIHHSPLTDQQLLELAAHAECFSTHPISDCLRRAYTGKIDKTRVESVREYGGHGVVAIIDGTTVAVGNDKLMQEQGIHFNHCHTVGTIVHIAVDGAYFGHIVVRDMLKPTAKEAIQALHRIHMRQTVMLTGDQKDIAAEVAADLGIDQVRSELLPEDKLTIVKSMQENYPHKGKLVFVGDGINDAPVLAGADLGIAMGALGADAAIEAADVVLMDDDPLKIAKAIRIAKKCMAIVYENLIGAIGIKVAVLILSAFGIANMWMAIFADVGVMMLAVLNAMRALSVKHL